MVKHLVKTLISMGDYQIQIKSTLSKITLFKKYIFLQKLEYSHFLKVHWTFFFFFLQREFFHFLPI